MNKKLKLALAALLGFSAACSTVKNTPTKGGEPQETAEEAESGDSIKIPPRIVVMYGVRPPGQNNTSISLKSIEEQEAAEASKVDPVVEKPADDIPAIDTKKDKAPATGQNTGK